jgi:ubiquitin-protein ligase
VQSSGRQWWQSDSGHARLVIEQKAMMERLPHFRLFKLDDDRMAWSGTLTAPPRTDTATGNTYEVLLVYPPSFPNQPPSVTPIDPVLEVADADGVRLIHQYNDGHMCLYYPNDRTFTPNTTAATVLAVAAAWLFAYEEWQASGRWPGPAADREELGAP